MPEQLLHAHDEQVRGSIPRWLPAGWTAYPDEHVLRVRTAHRGFAFSGGLHRLDSGHVERAVEATLAFFSTAWLVTLPGTEFAGLWGGSTLEARRHRGIYRFLVAVRARAAEQLGIRYLWVDASEDSPPILQRLGMTAVATTTPWIKHTSGQA